MTEGDGTASSTTSPSTPATAPASVSKNFRSAYYEKLGFCGNDEKNYLDILIEASPFDDEKLSELCERPELDRKCIEAWKLMLGVECDRKNPFDDYANVRRIRSEHYQLLKHHLEVLLKYNSLMKARRSSALASGRSRENDHHDEKDMRQRASRHEPHQAETHHGEQYHQHHHHHNQNDQNHTTQHNHHNYQQLNEENEDKLRARAGRARLITMMYLLESGGLDTLDIDGQLESQECRRLLSMATFFVSVAQDLQEAFFLLRNFTNHIRNKTTSSSPS